MVHFHTHTHNIEFDVIYLIPLAEVAPALAFITTIASTGPGFTPLLVVGGKK